MGIAITLAVLLTASSGANAFICLLAGAENKRMQRTAPYVPWQPLRPGYQPLPPIMQPSSGQAPRYTSRPSIRPRAPAGVWRPVN